MTDPFFNTIYGRNLIAELSNFAHQPCLVVTMDDLWPKFESHFNHTSTHVYFVNTLDFTELDRQVEKLPGCNSVVGLGGGQALDVAKFVAWKLRLPLFQVPTAMTVDAAFGHRAAIRFEGNVRYIGWAVPEAVYIDYDVIQSAPPMLNRSGVGDIFCFHTAHYDWKLAHNLGKTEPQWPYNPHLVSEARPYLDAALAHLDDIHAVNDTGIQIMIDAHRYGGGSFHGAGWNPRHVEGVEHFFFYTLEYLTRKHFIHGQPVCLGVYIGAALQENQPEEMLAAIKQVEVDIRPEAMGLTWDDAAGAMRQLAEYVKQAGLFYTVANHKPITEDFIDHVRERIYQTFGPWSNKRS